MGLGGYGDLTSPGGINLFPQNVFSDMAAESAAADAAAAAAAAETARNTGGPQTIRIPTVGGSHNITVPGAFDFQPASGAQAEKARAQTLGPTYAALNRDPRIAAFDEHISAEAALAQLPAAIVGSLARPAIGEGYNLIDKIPEAIRRPFEKDYGLLIDSALAMTNAAAMPLVSESVKSFNPGGDKIPKSVDLPVQAYGQLTMACGETASATILKSLGEPVALGGVDTQIMGGGGNLLEEAEFKRRGLTSLSGMGDMTQLKTFVATGYPVMVSVGHQDGGGHFAVVSGYDENTKTLTIKNWDAKGNTVKVPYDSFSKDWALHKNYMTAVIPNKDPRLGALLKAGDPRRPDKIYEGLTLSDFFVTQSGKVFVEGAYRHVGKDTDVTVKVNFNTKEEELSRQIGGSVSIKQKINDDWNVGLEVTKMSVRGQADDYASFTKSPVAVYGSIRGPGVEIKAGGERGSFQASVAADLSKALTGMGLQANASVNADGSYKVYAGISGTF